MDGSSKIRTSSSSSSTSSSGLQQPQPLTEGEFIEAEGSLSEIYRNPITHTKKRVSYPPPLVLSHHNNSEDDLPSLVNSSNNNNSNNINNNISNTTTLTSTEPLLPPIMTNSEFPVSENPGISPNFDFITKLPTPIVGPSGSFASFQASPPRYDGIDKLESLDIRKFPQRRNQHFTQLIQPPNRVVSEYRPNLVAERSAYKLQQVVTDDGRAKRFVSNPLEQETKLVADDIDKEKGNYTSVEVDETEVEKIDEDQNMLQSEKADVVMEEAVSSTATPGESQVGLFEGTLLTEKYKYVKDIGSGLFSKVILAQGISNGKPIAIKIISVPHSSRDEVRNFKSFIKREIRILFQLHHPSIIELLDYKVNLKMNLDTTSACTSDTDEDSENDPSNTSTSKDLSESEFQMLSDKNNNQLMFLKYSCGGNLFEFLQQYFQMETEVMKRSSLRYWKVIERVICELLHAVGYLHQENIIHRDIKLENILLNYSAIDLLSEEATQHTKSIICLTDFGLSKKVSHADELLTTRCGSEDYIPPELLMGLSYNGQLTDAWSIGVVIYALLENRLPFDLPPLSAMINSNGSAGISPSVLKRQRQRNKTPHRIAMIDWGWFKVTDFLNDPEIDVEVKQLISKFQKLTDKLLVRKQNRPKVLEILNNKEFDWLHKWNPTRI